MSSKELLMDVIGEEQTQDFAHGVGIKIESPDGYTYIITKMNDQFARVVRRGGSIVNVGTLRGDDIYDVVAAFAVSARLNQVNWQCGNIPVKLPSIMPPRNLGFLTFVFEKFRTVLGDLSRVPSFLRKMHNDLVHDEDSCLLIDFIIVVIFGMLSCVVLLVLGIFAEILFGFIIDAYHIVYGCFLLGLLDLVYISFKRGQITCGGEVD